MVFLAVFRLSVKKVGALGLIELRRLTCADHQHLHHIRLDRLFCALLRQVPNTEVCSRHRLSSHFEQV